MIVRSVQDEDLLNMVRGNHVVAMGLRVPVGSVRELKVGSFSFQGIILSPHGKKSLAPNDKVGDEKDLVRSLPGS